jgi:hypothetical protein
VTLLRWLVSVRHDTLADMAVVHTPEPVESFPDPARRWIGGASAVVLTVLWAVGVWRVWSHTLAKPLELDWSPYAYSDYLINYAGGFVRRGLGGEILRRLGSGGTASLPTVNVLVFGVYLLFSLAFLRLAFRIGVTRQRLLAMLVFWLAPGGPLGDAVEGDFYPRKDFLFLLFVLGIAWLAGRRRGWASTAVLLAVTLAGSAALSLIQEGFLFIGAVPIALVLYDRFAADGPPRASIVACLYLIFCVLLFGAASLFKGDAATVTAIWHSIGAANRAIIAPDGVPADGIEALQLSLLEGMDMPWAYLRTGLIWYWVVGLAASAAICLYVAASPDADGRRTSLARAVVLYGAIVAGTAPLYLLAWDWGRWIVAANVAFFFLYDRLRHLPPPLERASARLAPRLPAFASTLAPLAIGAFLVLFELTYRLPECCISGPSRHFVGH